MHTAVYEVHLTLTLIENCKLLSSSNSLYSPSMWIYVVCVAVPNGDFLIFFINYCSCVRSYKREYCIRLGTTILKCTRCVFQHFYYSFPVRNVSWLASFAVNTGNRQVIPQFRTILSVSVDRHSHALPAGSHSE